jgi:hypothetical protein
VTTRTLAFPEFDALFDEFTTSVTRLEALPLYAVGGAEQERIDAHRGCRPRPLRNVLTDPWLARIAITTLIGGRRWSRFRVMDDPLTDYQHYQLASYRESQAVGERVQIARRPDIGDAGPDFWLFDERLVVLMHYRTDGRLDRRELRDEPAVVADCSQRLTALAAATVSLNEFLVELDG